ncbi:Crp/Fnr family transcriptional regulator [Salinifilum ghardaiensis]
MASAKFPSGVRQQAMRLFGGRDSGDSAETALRQAAWVARCVGRGAMSPLGREDVTALAAFLHARRFAEGQPVFGAGASEEHGGVWILQSGRVELATGSGPRRSVVHVLHPGDVDGDVQHLLDMPFPYGARALDEVTALFLDAEAFEGLLTERPAISRRWLSSVAQRLATSQQRVIGLLGRTLQEQVARLLLDEAVDGEVLLPQRTVAAMIGVQRPSLNKVLKDFERRGFVELGYGSVTLRNPDALAASCE